MAFPPFFVREVAAEFAVPMASVLGDARKFIFHPSSRGDQRRKAVVDSIEAIAKSVAKTIVPATKTVVAGSLKPFTEGAKIAFVDKDDPPVVPREIRAIRNFRKNLEAFFQQIGEN